MTPAGEHGGLLRAAVISTPTEELRRVAGPDRPRYDEETVRAAEEELARRGRGAGEGLRSWARRWDSVCGNCGRPVKGFSMARQFPWERVLPYCRLCDEYALRAVHVAAIAAAVIVPLVALALLARYMFSG